MNVSAEIQKTMQIWTLRQWSVMLTCMSLSLEDTGVCTEILGKLR